MGHGGRGHAVGDERGGDLLVDQLEGSQPGSLVVGPRLRAEGPIQTAQGVQGADDTCSARPAEGQGETESDTWAEWLV